MNMRGGLRHEVWVENIIQKYEPYGIAKYDCYDARDSRALCQIPPSAQGGRSLDCGS